MPNYPSAVYSMSLVAVLTACGPALQTTEVAAPVALVAVGEAQPLAIETTEFAGAAASVVKVDFLQNQGDASGVKLFGAAGGDPAANGLHTYIAFYTSPGGDWAVFPIGDFLEYRILSDAPGRVDLEIDATTIDEATGEMGSETRRAIVTWSWPTGDMPPESVTITQAR